MQIYKYIVYKNRGLLKGDQKKYILRHMPGLLQDILFPETNGGVIC